MKMERRMIEISTKFEVGDGEWKRRRRLVERITKGGE
jgi:hypothetical protein